MIVRRYGSWYHSVTPSFNPSAMTEIGFRRDRQHSFPADEFSTGHRLVDAGEVQPRPTPRYSATPSGSFW